MLNNLTVKHLGRVVHSCFYPFIGSDPFSLSSDRLSSSCEIYECKDKKLFILQIRSRVFPSKFEEFGDLIFQLIKKFSFKQTVVITSGSSAYFPAEQLQHMGGHRVPSAKVSFYCGTKFMVRALVEGLRQELKAEKSGIRVATISLGLVETEFAYNMYDNPEDARKVYESMNCLQASDIADSVVYILSTNPRVDVNDILLRPAEQLS